MINLKETRRLKEELQKYPGDVEKIINSTPLAVCITSQAAKFLAVNDNYCSLYGYQQKELIGNPFTIVLPEANKQSLERYHARFFVDKYEIIRKWIVMNKKGQLMEIFADAGYNEKIFNQPSKITLIQFVKYVETIPSESGYAHTSINRGDKTLP